MKTLKWKPTLEVLEDRLALSGSPWAHGLGPIAYGTAPGGSVYLDSVTHNAGDVRAPGVTSRLVNVEALPYFILPNGEFLLDGSVRGAANHFQEKPLSRFQQSEIAGELGFLGDDTEAVLGFSSGDVEGILGFLPDGLDPAELGFFDPDSEGVLGFLSEQSTADLGFLDDLGTVADLGFHQGWGEWDLVRVDTTNMADSMGVHTARGINDSIWVDMDLPVRELSAKGTGNRFEKQPLTYMTYEFADLFI